MATVALSMDVENIGSMAGQIWQYLSINGPVTLAKLTREVGGPRDLTMQGIGWLAREGKVQFQESSRSRLILLTEP